MTNNQDIKLNYDFNKLELASIAKDYLQQGKQGLPFAQKSLELVLKDIGMEDPWMINTISDPEVIQKTIKNQLDVYNHFKLTQKVGDLIGYYDNSIKDILGDKAKDLEEKLSPFKDRKYIDIQKELNQAEHTIKGYQIESNSKEEAEKAQKVLQKYEILNSTLSLLDMQNNSKLKCRVEDAVARDDLSRLYSKGEDQE